MTERAVFVGGRRDGEVVAVQGELPRRMQLDGVQYKLEMRYVVDMPKPSPVRGRLVRELLDDQR